MVFVMVLGFSFPLAAGSPENPKVVYLDLETCEVCQTIKDHGVLEGLEDEGIEVVVYDVVQDPLMADKYAQTYGVEGGRAAPIIFAGDTYFRGDVDIIDAYEEGEIQARAEEPLKDLSGYEARNFTFLTGLFLIIISGLLDGVNPCAIAMLLMFISMISFTQSRRKMLVVSFSYIISVLLTYFLIGLGFLTLLGISRQAFTNISFWLYSFFAVLTLILSIVTFYDFLVSKNEKYEKIKNQLPSPIRRFNQTLMKRMTAILEDKEAKKRTLAWLILIPSFIGVLVGITEAACTGQIYIAVLASIEANNPAGGMGGVELIYLIVFNLMFIVPLVIIAVVAIKTKNTMAVANFMRERLSLVKLLTALFFLLMAGYFVLLALDVNWLTFDWVPFDL